MVSPEENLKKKKPVIPPKPPRKETELLIDPEITSHYQRRRISLPSHKVKRALKENDCPLEITESSLLEKLAEDDALSHIRFIITTVGLTNKEALTHLKSHDAIGDWLRFSYREVKSDIAKRIKKLAELARAFH